MISSDEAAKQIARLSGLNFFPRESAAVKELRLAGEAAASLSVLVVVVDSWLELNTEAPKPAELRNLIWEQNGKIKTTRSGCGLCGGTGWRIVERGQYSGAAPCSCQPATHHARTKGDAA